MRALVTGASGHLGHNLVALLLARGHTVSATIRSLANTAQVARLRALGPVTVHEADARREDQLRRALAEADVLFHLAAVYSITDRAREQDLLESSVLGAESAMRAAAACGVQRVILTSSLVAVPLTAPGAPPSTEADWAADLRVPYIRAKVEAERRAWELAGEFGIALATILPGGIIGPGFARATPALDILTAIRMGEFRLFAPSGNFPLVDARDAAEAHALAAERRATGRFIVAYDAPPSYDELVRAVARLDPRVKPPLMVSPPALAPLVPLYDALSHHLLGTPRLVTPEAAASTLGRRGFNYSTARARQDLGWAPRVPLEESLRATLAALDALGSRAVAAAAH